MLAPLIRASVLLLFLLATTLVVQGHAILISSEPAKGQVVKGPEIKVSLRFNSRVDAKRSRLTLVAPGGKEASLAIDKRSAVGSLSSNATGLSVGAYVLRWQVLAGDGHVSRGEVAFRIE